MKKAITILLALGMVLSLAACGTAKENAASDEKNPSIEAQTSESNEILLTLENCYKYLNIGAAARCDSDIFDGKALGVQMLNGGKGIETKNGYHTFYVYKYINLFATVSGVSQNYNYNDISVTIKIQGTYRTYDDSKVNSGVYGFSGTETFEKEIEIECNVAGSGSFKEAMELSDGLYTHDDVIQFEVEVIKISGSISPA